jgi:hypothetical protein
MSNAVKLKKIFNNDYFYTTWNFNNYDLLKNINNNYTNTPITLLFSTRRKEVKDLKLVSKRRSGKLIILYIY